MTTFHEYTKVARSRFHEAYGQTMMAWSALEEMLFHWFVVTTKLDEAIARAVFYSARSFTGRRDMFAATLPHSGLDDDTQEFLRACIKKAAQFSAFRNIAAHGMDKYSSKDGEPAFVLASPQTPDPVPEDQAITVEQLEHATEHFYILRGLMFDLHPNSCVPASSPEAYLPLVRGLPNRADSTEPNQWILDNWHQL